MANPNFTPVMSSDTIYHGTDTTRCVTDDLDALETGKAPVEHTHTGFASENHTHDGFAAEDHTHTGFFPTTGGDIDGNVNVKGVIRAQGQQAFFFDTNGSSQTIGTNNATGGTNICCGPSATMILNGAAVKAPTMLPRGNNTFDLGNTNFRWKGIYSTAAVNVSSDERMKRDISDMEVPELADFVNRLKVVSYNYKNDEADTPARIGLIAQDVQMADPTIAKFFVTEGEDGMLGLRPADLVFPLIAAVQRLTAEVAELKSR